MGVLRRSAPRQTDAELNQCLRGPAACVFAYAMLPFGTRHVTYNMKNVVVTYLQVPINTLDRRDEQFKESLENEVNIMILGKALKHEHIVEYLGHDYMDSCLYLYLEHVPGGSITQALNDFGAFAESLMASYAKQTLAGLEYLHSREPAVIHRALGQ
eukprot:g29205.t1